jgi:hypothetical protein
MNDSHPARDKEESQVFPRGCETSPLGGARRPQRERALGTLHEALVRLPWIGLDWIGLDQLANFFHSVLFHCGFSGKASVLGGPSRSIRRRQVKKQYIPIPSHKVPLSLTVRSHRRKKQKGEKRKQASARETFGLKHEGTMRVKSKQSVV